MFFFKLKELFYIQGKGRFQTCSTPAEAVALPARQISELKLKGNGVSQVYNLRKCAFLTRISALAKGNLSSMEQVSSAQLLHNQVRGHKLQAWAILEHRMRTLSKAGALPTCSHGLTERKSCREQKQF